jgi:CubicO group peptidase (beta-lactamase class C family)
MPLTKEHKNTRTIPSNAFENYRSYKMKKIINLLLILSVFASIAYGQTKSLNTSRELHEASPEEAGISPERLARIDQMCEDAVASEDLPGIVALVARDGKIVHWKAYGMADNQAGRKLKRDDIFRIASQTKAITSTAIMMLWEEGHFQLDDPVSRYIPEFKNPQVLKTFNPADSSWTGEPANSEITIRQLLTHTSGIGYGLIDSDERIRMIYQKAGVTDLFTTENISIEESVKKLARLPLHFHPGTAYQYSEGLDVLGYFIEVVSGMPFDEFLKTRIFDPLGMNDTRFYFSDDKAARLVAVQHKKEEKWEKYPVTFYDTDYPVKGAKRFFSGGAGLSSTAKDYAVFLQMYLNGGEYNGVRLLSRTTVRSIMGNQTDDLWGGDEKHYGLAFGVVTPEGQDKGGIGSAGTFDWGGYFNTQYFADPQEGVIGIIMKQTQGDVNDQTGWKFRQLVFQTIDD